MFGKDSDIQDIGFGVPQGSVLGPLLFLIYINNIVAYTSTSPEVELKLFADDTAILISHSNLETLERIAMDTLNRISHWLVMNKLSLNMEKTVGMFFHANKRKRTENWTPKINIGHFPLKFTQHIKYLGFILDCGLSFKDHILHLITKLRKWIGIFRRINSLLTHPAKYSLYNSLIYPHILYGIELYGNSNKMNIHGLQIIQNKALKALFGYHMQYPSQKLYSELKINNINVLFKIRTSLLIKTLLSQPASLNVHCLLKEYCTPVGAVHSYSTRDKLNFNLKFEKISFTMSTTFKMLLIWNSIPSEIKRKSPLAAFKHSVYLLFSNSL